ncbi:transcriptional regulator [Actinomadura sp. BRA 177]|uniref:transcriptional regulator n=1 Tax=Actinomadura sp. BRA 177 TaxID=2745202 RepID=UPI001596292C|nr:transcriptional regulator [Actinomadura sp. BRA 177]NVI91237.1 transcriptional regulator [Actinomadura sp. BRA 177]
MFPGKKAIGLRLRKAREAPPYWSRPDLARLLRAAADPRDRPGLPHVSPLAEMIKHWEAGKFVPGHRYRPLYVKVTGMSEDDLFGADEALTPDDRDRLAQAIARPARVDLTVVGSLATILAAQRRLNDTADPAAILPATLAQTDVATTLLQAARGPVRDALAPVAAEYVQFSGWLRAEHRDDQRAAHLLTDAEALADDAGSGELAAQAVNFKGYLARQQGNARGVVRHFLTAYHTPGAAPAQRLGDAVLAAHGHALLGDHADARRLLAEAETLEDAAASSLPPDTAYWLTPDFQHVNIGLALLGLGEHDAAAEHLQAGLESLPPDQRDAAWTAEYRDALRQAREAP